MAITRRDIEQDIIKYARRLQKLQNRLDALPPKGRIPAEGRKLKQTGRTLEAEIQHVEGLIGLATEALEG